MSEGGQVRDQWVSQWIGEGCWWLEPPPPPQIIDHFRHQSIYPQTAVSFLLWPLDETCLHLSGSAHALPALSPTGLLGEEWKPKDWQALFKGCDKSAKPLTWKLRERNLNTSPSSRYAFFSVWLLLHSLIADLAGILNDAWMEWQSLMILFAV